MKPATLPHYTNINVPQIIDFSTSLGFDTEDVDFAQSRFLPSVQADSHDEVELHCTFPRERKIILGQKRKGELGQPEMWIDRVSKRGDGADQSTNILKATLPATPDQIISLSKFQRSSRRVLEITLGYTSSGILREVSLTRERGDMHSGDTIDQTVEILIGGGEVLVKCFENDKVIEVAEPIEVSVHGATVVLGGKAQVAKFIRQMLRLPNSIWTVNIPIPQIGAEMLESFSHSDLLALGNLIYVQGLRFEENPSAIPPSHTRLVTTTDRFSKP